MNQVNQNEAEDDKQELETVQPSMEANRTNAS